jgi:hypothetical protein
LGERPDSRVQRLYFFSCHENCGRFLDFGSTFAFEFNATSIVASQRLRL